MRLTMLWPSGFQVDEAGQVEVFSRELLDRITADPSVETSIAGDKLTIRATNGTWVYKLDRAGATVTEITGHLIPHRDTGSIDIYELEEETETPRFGDGFNLVLENVRAEARQTRNLIRRIMSDLQTHLDTDISALADVIDGLEAEISSLKAAATNTVAVPAAELDFTNADALVAQAKDALASLAGPPAAAAADPSAAGAASGDTAAPTQPSGTAAASADAAAGSSAVSGPADPAPLTVTTTLPPAWVGQAYTAGISPEGGTGPFTWSFSGLPSGLSGAPDGTITGTPTAVGDASVSLSVTDSTGATATGTATLSVTA